MSLHLQVIDTGEYKWPTIISLHAFWANYFDIPIFHSWYKPIEIGAQQLSRYRAVFKISIQNNPEFSLIQWCLPYWINVQKEDLDIIW